MSNIQDALVRAGLKPQPAGQKARKHERTNSLKPGDILQIAGVYQVNPQYREDLPGCPHKPKWMEPHTCPYKSDLNDDHSTLCRCCPDCEKNCADEL